MPLNPSHSRLITNTDRLTSRVLTAADRSSIQELFADTNSILQCEITPEYGTNFQHTLNFFLNPNSNGKAIGTFLNDRLICFLTMYFWQQLPYWSFANLKSLSVIGHKHRGISKTMAMMFAIAEEMNLNTYYVLVNADKKDAFDKYYWKYVPESHAYHSTLEAIIPKFTKPQHEIYWSLMGNKIWPVDLAVGCAKKIQARQT